MVEKLYWKTYVELSSLQKFASNLVQTSALTIGDQIQKNVPIRQNSNASVNAT